MATDSFPFCGVTSAGGCSRLSLVFMLEARVECDRLEVGRLPSCERVRGVWGGVVWSCGGAYAPSVSFSVSPFNWEVEGCREVDDALGAGLGSVLERKRPSSDSFSFDDGSSEAAAVGAGAGEGLTAEDFRRGIKESRTWPK